MVYDRHREKYEEEADLEGLWEYDGFDNTEPTSTNFLIIEQEIVDETIRCCGLICGCAIDLESTAKCSR
jgi:hypothetical protein